MAWRDSRGFRRRLLFHTAAIAIGIAALTALRGLSLAMEAGAARQAAELLGADLEIESRQPFSGEAEAVFDSLGGRQARQVETHSMVLLPASGGSRLVEVRALEGEWPFYGRVRTDPPGAWAALGAGRGALVDDGVMRQFDAQVGDSVQVGRRRFWIAGRVLAVPGETAVRSDVRPPVFIPLQHLDETGLVQYGSRVEHKRYFAFDDGRPAGGLAGGVEERLRLSDPGLDADTAADRQRRLGRTIRNLDAFLGLGGFIALLLGAVGVASAIHAHVEQKLEIVAVLRALGASSRQALAVYLLQAGAMGLAGSLAGALAGLGVMLLLPHAVAGFLPVAVEVTLSLRPLLEGVGIGTAIAVLFAARPLLAVRGASPLLALRASYETGTRAGDRLLRLLVLAAAAAGACVVALLLAGRVDHALMFTGGTAAALLLLAAAALALRAGTRRFFPRRWSYVWRQGLANLHRPHNQTLLLLVSLGLGVFLVAALHTAQSSILSHLARLGGGDQPNMVLFDIQTDQREAVAELVEGLGMPVLQQVPVVAMRLAEVKGRSVDEIADERGGRRGNWALHREYRSTYRDHLTDSERLLSGRHGAALSGPAAAADAEGGAGTVSLEQGVAARLGVTVGDELVFDVQGVRVPVTVSGLREVDWQRIMPNFLVVFSTGVLERAPQFHVLVSRADIETRARLQREVVGAFPNVSAIDLDLILRTVDKVLDRVAAVVRFMALFSVATGLVVLAASVSASRFQRLRESALLRTLGASRRQVGRILLVEYAALGALAAATGLALALGGGWGLATWVFDVAFQPAWGWLAGMAVAVPLLTVAFGVAGSRGVRSVPPLEVLRRAG